jgi:sulfhydrogenase subunit delta
MTAPQPKKPRVAFFDFTSCEGCQLTVVDSLQTHPELLEVIDIVEFREAVTGTASEYDVAFIEGSCTRPSDEERLRQIRAKAKFVVALGSCAHIGGVNAIKNRMASDEVREVVYADKAHLFDTYAARPISAIVPIDCTIPGCPINPTEFLRIVTFLMQGRIPDLIDYPVCIDCKLLETPRWGALASDQSRALDAEQYVRHAATSVSAVVALPPTPILNPCARSWQSTGYLPMPSRIPSACS